MNAVVLKNFGSVDQLKLKQIKRPEINENEVLIKVKVFSINPVDIKTRQGEAMASRLKHYDPLILGWDVAGVISKLGKNVNTFKVGDPVFGMLNFIGHGQAYAEYVAAPVDQIAKIPPQISFAQAAASTLAALTAWQAFTYYGKLKKDDKVLIHGASGGVGHFAVQIAKYLCAYVIGTSSVKNRDFVLSLGADQHVDYNTQKFEDSYSNLDFVLESIGNENFQKSVKTLKKGGTIINLPSGHTKADEHAAEAKNLKANYFMSVFSDGKHMQKIADLLEAELLIPNIGAVFKFNQIQEAHLHLEHGGVRGKIIVEID
ncbi:NADP-dependent oxidoreductase [Zunongwangia sp.]|uniref:NADP-dependent oxidoreductase n=1 Tax=Zunongwangia sp. TaxID=1965325 RepID=UPI003AA91A80